MATRWRSAEKMFPKINGTYMEWNDEEKRVRIELNY